MIGRKGAKDPNSTLWGGMTDCKLNRKMYPTAHKKEETDYPNKDNPKCL